MKVLESWLSKSSMKVKWNGTLSQEVSLTAGVRQGGVLSPLLFAVYVDIILERLENSGLGCFVGKQCYNSFLYADDLIILSISISDLQQLMNICYNTFTEIGLTINLTKSHCIRIGERHSKSCSEILVQDQPIAWKKETKFLGVMFKNTKTFTCDWKDSKSKFYKASNAILSKLGSNPPIEVCLNLIRLQCLPILTYGMCANSMTAADINKLAFAYNSIFFKLFRCNSRQTIEYCQYFCNFLPLVNLLDYNRFIFLRKLYMTDVLCCESALDRSDFCDMLSICVKYGLLISDSVTCVRGKIWNYVRINLEI